MTLHHRTSHSADQPSVKWLPDKYNVHVMIEEDIRWHTGRILRGKEIKKIARCLQQPAVITMGSGSKGVRKFWYYRRPEGEASYLQLEVEYKKQPDGKVRAKLVSVRQSAPDENREAVGRWEAVPEEGESPGDSPSSVVAVTRSQNFPFAMPVPTQHSSDPRENPEAPSEDTRKTSCEDTHIPAHDEIESEWQNALAGPIRLNRSTWDSALSLLRQTNLDLDNHDTGALKGILLKLVAEPDVLFNRVRTVVESAPVAGRGPKLMWYWNRETTEYTISNTSSDDLYRRIARHKRWANCLFYDESIDGWELEVLVQHDDGLDYSTITSILLFPWQQDRTLGEIADRRGIEIELHRTNWRDHILKHPELGTFYHRFADLISMPNLIIQVSSGNEAGSQAQSQGVNSPNVVYHLGCTYDHMHQLLPGLAAKGYYIRVVLAYKRGSLAEWVTAYKCRKRAQTYRAKGNTVWTLIPSS